MYELAANQWYFLYCLQNIICDLSEEKRLSFDIRILKRERKELIEKGSKRIFVYQ